MHMWSFKWLRVLSWLFTVLFTSINGVRKMKANAPMIVNDGRENCCMTKIPVN